MWLRPSHDSTPGSAHSALDSLTVRLKKHGPKDVIVCFYSGYNLLPRYSSLLLVNLYLYQKNKFQDIYLLWVINHSNPVQKDQI